MLVHKNLQPCESSDSLRPNPASSLGLHTASTKNPGHSRFNRWILGGMTVLSLFMTSLSKTLVKAKPVTCGCKNSSFRFPCTKASPKQRSSRFSNSDATTIHSSRPDPDGPRAEALHRVLPGQRHRLVHRPDESFVATGASTW